MTTNRQEAVITDLMGPSNLQTNLRPDVSSYFRQHQPMPTRTQTNPPINMQRVWRSRNTGKLSCPFCIGGVHGNYDVDVIVVAYVS